MEIESTLTRKMSRDILGDWVDREISRIISSFIHKGVLDKASIDVGPSSDWGMFLLDGDKRICSQYNACDIPFHEGLFSLTSFYLSFNEYDISVMNNLMIPLSQLHLVSHAFVKVFQY